MADNSDKPAISIVMPSFQYGRYIGTAASSVLSETSVPVELVVQDAVSTDDTREILESFGSDRLRFHIEADGGQSDALNRALARSRGSWIGWLNADEYYLPGAIAAMYNFIGAHPEADVVYGDCLFVDANGKTLRLVPAHPFSPHVLKQYGCYISSCTTFVRRKALEDVGWDTSMRVAMDWDLWLTLAETAKFMYAPITVAAFRVHPGQITAKRLSPDALSEFQRIRRKHKIVPSTLGRTVAHAQHVALKTLSGAYLRQLHRA